MIHFKGGFVKAYSALLKNVYPEVDLGYIESVGSTNVFLDIKIVCKQIQRKENSHQAFLICRCFSRHNISTLLTASS